MPCLRRNNPGLAAGLLISCHSNKIALLPDKERMRSENERMRGKEKEREGERECERVVPAARHFSMQTSSPFLPSFLRLVRVQRNHLVSTELETDKRSQEGEKS